MRVAVLGPGAIGISLAAAVAETGEADLSVIGRSPLEEISANWPDGSTTTTPCDTEVPEGPVDWLLLCVKAHQVPDAGHVISSLCGPSTAVLVAMNGVEHQSLVAPFVGGAEVLPAVLWFAAERTSPFHAKVTTPPIVIVDEGPRADELRRILGGRITLVSTDDLVTESWRKLCRNAVGGLMALTARTSEVFDDPLIAELGRQLAVECIEVARSQGATLELAYAEEIIASMQERPREEGNSMLADRLAGLPLEVEARNGVICRLGREAGVPTPVSDVVVALLSAVSGRRPPASASG